MVKEEVKELADLRNNATNELAVGYERVYIELYGVANVTSVKDIKGELLLELLAEDLTFEGKTLKLEDINKIGVEPVEMLEEAQEKYINWKSIKLNSEFIVEIGGVKYQSEKRYINS